MILWGHGNRASIPPLHTYEDAKAHFEKVVPIRGRGEQVKPLGKNRRYTWYRIAEKIVANQFENSEYRVYTCQLFGKDTVSFFPNGDIHINTDGWRSITTGSFINCILTSGVGNIQSESGKWYFTNHIGESFRFINNMILRKEDGWYKPTEVVPDVVHRINRKAMNSIRNKYRHVIDYGKSMLAIDPKLTKVSAMELSKNGISSNRFLPYHYWQSKDTDQSRAKWFELASKQRESGDLELLYDLARYVAMSAGRYSYRDDTYSCEPTAFAGYVDEMMKFEFKDEIFNKEVLPIGEVSADRNKKYFNVRVYG